jgi:hypothetical protein
MGLYRYRGIAPLIHNHGKIEVRDQLHVPAALSPERNCGTRSKAGSVGHRRSGPSGEQNRHLPLAGTDLRILRPALRRRY